MERGRLVVRQGRSEVGVVPRVGGRRQALGGGGRGGGGGLAS